MKKEKEKKVKGVELKQNSLAPTIQNETTPGNSPSDHNKIDEIIPECNPILWIWIKDMTMSSSYMAFHQNRNVFEDWVRKKTYSTKKYLEVIYWLKLLYYGLEWVKYVQKFIF